MLNWVSRNDYKKSHLKAGGLKKIKKNWMGGVSIISGSLSGAQGAFPARQISSYYRWHDYKCIRFILFDT